MTSLSKLLSVKTSALPIDWLLDRVAPPAITHEHHCQLCQRSDAVHRWQTAGIIGRGVSLTSRPEEPAHPACRSSRCREPSGTGDTTRGRACVVTASAQSQSEVTLCYGT